MRRCFRFPLHYRVVVFGFLLAISASLLLPLQTARAATVLFVTPTGAGSANGTDWANATTLQAALSTAAAGTEIWVRAGTYVPGTERTDFFALKSGVAIYGGFAGGENMLSQRDPASNITVLSGDIGIPNVVTDNSYHVVVGYQVDDQAVLDGFTISGGYAVDHCFGYTCSAYGGGIQLMYSYATIRNCVIRDNRAETGGGIVTGVGRPILTNLVIADNQATYGGGMSIDDAVVSYVTFLHNRGDFGGALEIIQGNPHLSEILVDGNQATYWGGGILVDQSTPELRQATLVSNSAPQGGAIAIMNTTFILRNSIAWGNGPNPFAINITGTVDVGYSIVEGGYAGTGNVSLDPQFVSIAGADGTPGTADDDLHLQAGSPAIDSGNNADIPADLGDRDQDGTTSEAIGTDLDGHPRVTNGTVDMGVYEADSPILPTLTPSATPTSTPAVLPTTSPVPSATSSPTPSPTWRLPSPTSSPSPSLPAATTAVTPSPSPSPTSSPSPSLPAATTTATPGRPGLSIFLPLIYQ